MWRGEKYGVFFSFFSIFPGSSYRFSSSWSKNTVWALSQTIIGSN